jgi:hypothetical protein
MYSSSSSEVEDVAEGKDDESTPVDKVEVKVADVADGSVEAVEVMLVVESRLINKAKGFAAAKTTARTRAKMVERRILLVLREWRVW